MQNFNYTNIDDASWVCDYLFTYLNYSIYNKVFNKYNYKSLVNVASIEAFMLVTECNRYSDEYEKKVKKGIVEQDNIDEMRMLGRRNKISSRRSTGYSEYHPNLYKDNKDYLRY